MPPNLGPLKSKVLRLTRVQEAGGPGRVCPLDRGDISDCGVRSLFVGVSTPLIQSHANVFQ